LQPFPGADIWDIIYAGIVKITLSLGIMADKIITAFKFANLFTVVIRTLYA
jgi:hypothetical protein